MEKQYFESLVEKKEGRMLAVASDDTVDRMGDSLKAEKWDLTNYLKNPVLQLSHDYSQPPIGIAKNIEIHGNKLFFEPVFHEITQQAKEVKALFEAGIMKAFSVGFIPAKGENGKYELLEISAVSIPANPNALLVARSLDAKIIKDVSVWVCKSVNGKVECPKEDLLIKNALLVARSLDAKIIKDVIEVKPEEKKEINLEEVKGINKSPKCRKADETEADCRSRKISEMISEGTEKEQASAIAYKLCAVACEVKATPKEGDECKMDDGEMGMMQPDKDGKLTCMKKAVPKEGDECEMDNGMMGEMHPDDEGHMVCMKKKKSIDEKDTTIENLKKELQETKDKLDEKEKIIGEIKGRDAKEVEKVESKVKDKKLILRALQIIAKSSNFAIENIKKTK